MDYPRPLYLVKPWRIQRRLLLPLYENVLECLHFDLDNTSELLICRLHPPYFTVRVAHPEKLFPLNNFGLADLPPAWPPHGKNGAR